MNNLYATLASSRVTQLQAVMNGVFGAEQTVLLPILTSLVAIYLTRQFLLYMWGGHMTLATLTSSITRCLIVTFFVKSSTNINTYFAQKVFTNIPQMLSQMATSSFLPSTTAGQSQAAQFDAMSSGANVIMIQIVKQTQFSSPSTWINSIGAVSTDGYFQLFNAITFGIWMLGISLMAIALALFPPFLLFELAERTRGWLDQLFGKLVGAISYGFATSVVLAMQLQQLETLLKSANGVATTNTAQALQVLMAANSNSILNLLLMIGCPLAFSFGSGVVAGQMAPAAMITRAAMVAAGPVGSAVRSGTRLVTRAGRNAVSS